MSEEEKKIFAWDVEDEYQRARMIGERACQLNDGADPLIEIGNLDNALDIATEEYRQGKMPIFLTLRNQQVKNNMNPHKKDVE